jgi:hypothetical protein
LGLAAGLMVPIIQETLDGAAMTAESRRLDDLAAAIERSWTNPDLPRNLALAGTSTRAVQSGTLNASDATSNFPATAFNGLWSPGIGATGVGEAFLTVVPAGSFEQKLVRAISGIDITDATDTGGPYNASNAPNSALYREAGDPGQILFNSRGYRRVFLRGPTNEAAQRWLIVSVMTPPANTAVRDLPPISFDALWSLSSSPSATLPSGGSGALATAWNSTHLGRTHTSRILVKRITQPKHRVNLSNSSSDRYLHVEIADGPNTFWVNSGTGAQGIDGASHFILSPGEVFPVGGITLLHGTEVTVRSGTLVVGQRGNTVWAPPGTAGDITNGPHVMTVFRIQDSTTLLLNPN